MLQATSRFFMIIEAGLLFAGALFLVAVSGLARAMWSRVRVA